MKHLETIIAGVIFAACIAGTCWIMITLLERLLEEVPV